MQELSMNVLDIAENSVAAGATLVKITLNCKSDEDLLELFIKDDGKGISEEMLKNITDPFVTSRATRKVGLGLPFLKMAAEMTGGSMSINSEVGKGTEVYACFTKGHIDLAPIGDMASTITTLIQCNPHMDFVYTLSCDGESFCADTREIKAILDGVSTADASVAVWIREYLQENTHPILKRSNLI